MESKFSNVKYIVPTDKLIDGEKKSVVLISDLHDYVKNKRKAADLVNEIAEKQPMQIIIAGDNFTPGVNPNAYNNFVYFLAALSEIAPVFMSQGNHDLSGQKESNKAERIRLFKSYEDARPGSVFALINDKLIIDGFEIIGYTPDPKIISSLDIQNHGIAHDRFIEEYMQNGIKPSDNSNNIVEFIGHNPNLIAASENGIGLEGLSTVDAFFTGHLHNGYIKSDTVRKNPDKWLDKGYVERIYMLDKDGKYIPGSVTPIWGPTNLCRGVIYVDDRSQQKIMQLSNNHFYINLAKEDNIQVWEPVVEELAKIKIIDDNLHALIISGGINKFFGLNRIGDQPEITEVVYEGKSR